jgi:flagellar hook-associated protein 1 FlgK
MSLFSTLQITNNSLIASQTGLQIVANNIANANTPGYTRQEVVFQPGATQLIGSLPLGLGVQIRAIIQQSDRFINERLRAAISDVENTAVQKQAYHELEAILGELTDTDLSTSLNQFLASIHDVLNQPEDLATRNLAALQGQKLADEITRFDSRVRQIRKDGNGTIVGAASDINRLTTEIAKLNVQIVAVEAGSSGISDAGGLRDQRSTALAELSKIIGIRTAEQESGAVTVYSNGDYLVYDGTARPVTVVYSEDRGLAAASINIVDSDSPIETSSGSLTGLYAARDTVLGGFLDQLDDFTKKLIFEFNKVFSSGQGLTGYSSIESEHKVTDTDNPLDSAGLVFTPVNGTFQVLVQNKRTGLATTTDIRVDLNGFGEDTTLEDLVAQLDAVDGLTATVNAQGGVSMNADSPALEFSFANDTSGVLAALGINTFFSGEAAIGIGVSETVRNDPSKFAASRAGIGADTDNAVALAGLATQPLDSTGGLTLTEYYEQFTADVFQASAVMQGINDGFQTFRATLEGQQLGISGVNVDEQAIKMLQFQRAFQASARLVSTINDLLDTLVNL